MPAHVLHSAYWTAVAYSPDKLQAIIRAIEIAVSETFLPSDLARRLARDYQQALAIHSDGGIPVLSSERVHSLKDWFQKLKVTLPEVRPERYAEKEFLLAGSYTADELGTIIKALTVVTECRFIERQLGDELIASYQKMRTIRLICDSHLVFPPNPLAPRPKWVEYVRQLSQG